MQVYQFHMLNKLYSYYCSCVQNQNETSKLDSFILTTRVKPMLKWNLV